jgi:hypothetical protein
VGKRIRLYGIVGIVQCSVFLAGSYRCGVVFVVEGRFLSVAVRC